jgi:hypothetical protein
VSSFNKQVARALKAALHDPEELESVTQLSE